MASRAVAIVKRLCKIDTIEIDSCLDESHTLSNTVTDHPVEQGANITDHCRPEPDQVTLRCFISNTPLSATQEERGFRQGDIKFNTTAVVATKIGAAESIGDNAFLKLEKLRNEGTLITLVTTLKTYESTPSHGMIIQSLTIPRTSRNYDGLEFSLTLKQVRIVLNRQTNDTQPKDKRTSTKKKSGAKTKGDPPPNFDSKLVQMGAPGAVRR